MRDTLFHRLLLNAVVLACIAGGCSGIQRDIHQSNIPEHASATHLLPIHTPRSTATLILSPTATSMLVPTTTLTPIPSVTPIPTLGITEAHKMLQFMIYQNGGCELPCWWGIMPGITKRDDMINWMMTFLRKVESDEVTYLDAVGDEKNATRTIVFSETNIETEYKYMFGVLSEEGIVRSILVDKDLTGQYSLPVLLRKYGKPKEILLTTLAASPNGMVPYNLVLYYPDQGILAYFSSPNGGRVEGNYVYICPQFTLPWLHLWAPDDLQQGEFEMKSLVSGDVRSQFKSIEAVSDLSIDEFHVIFQQKDNTTCIATEAEQWWNH